MSSNVTTKNLALSLALLFLSFFSNFFLGQCSSPPILNYSGVSSNYAVGVPITPLSLTNSGGSASSLSASVTTHSGQTGLGLNVAYYYPHDLVFDAAGNMYVSDRDNHVIRKITPSNVSTIFAGSGVPGDVDGFGTNAQFSFPCGLAIDPMGNIFVADRNNLKIKKITPSGSVTTFVGSGMVGSNDGLGTSATFHRPIGLCIDANNNLFLTDAANHLIRKITPLGMVSTVAGTGVPGYVDAINMNAEFQYPTGIDIDAQGNLYIADLQNHVIRKISTSGFVSTYAGHGVGYVDAQGVLAKFDGPNDVVLDGSGNLYVTDRNNHLIRRIDPSGYVSTVAGNPGVMNTTDGPASLSEFEFPTGLCHDNTGKIWITEKANVRRLNQVYYTITPTLPSGMTFDFNTGEIAGTPNVITPMTTYNIQGSNSCGNAQTQIAFSTSCAIPIITSFPVSQTVCVGNNATFTCSALGTALSYHWIHNTTVISISSTPILTLTGVSAADAGSYYCKVISPCGAAATAIATLTVISVAMPTILSQPVSVNACSGSNVNFTVVASGSGLTYQWQKNGIDIPGAVSSSLNINSVNNVDAADYTCIIQNGCFTVVSNLANLTINTSGIIQTHPFDAIVCESTNHTLFVVATGTGLNYQWKKNGTNISGATGSSFSFSPLVLSDAANYTCEVFGGCGSTISNVSTVTVIPNAITTQPQSQTACIGSTVVLTVVANGSGLTYQWKKGTSIISGATSNIFTLNSVTASATGNYTCEVTGSCGTITSNSAILNVSGNPPTINLQPVSQTVCVGSNVALNCIGGSGSNYQWYFGSNPIPGANSVTLILSGVGASHAGNYTCVVSTSCSSITSNIAVLTILPGSTITTQPISQTVCANGTVAFSIAATAANYYQWYLNNNYMGNSSTLTISNVSAIQQGTMYCIVGTSGTSLCQADTSNIVQLIVNSDILVQPTSQTVCVGSSATFSVGTPASVSTFQWKKNGIDISGANASSYMINSCQASDEGDYVCTIVGSCGTETTVCVQLTVNAFDPSLSAISYSAGSANYPTGSPITPLNLTFSGPGDLVPSDYGIYHFAGPVNNNTVGAVNGPANNATFNSARGITADANGNVFVADTWNHLIRKIDANGQVSTLAGTAGVSGGTDGIGVNATFNFPSGITADAAGNLYVCDYQGHKIRKITPAGVVTTIAGTGIGGFQNGNGSIAKFNSPSDITIDNLGNLYVADAGNSRIRKITPSGVTSTYAGTGVQGFQDGPAATAKFTGGYNITIDKFGNLYLAEIVSTVNRIRKICPDGMVSTIVSNGFNSIDGPLSAASFNWPTSMFVDNQNNLHVLETYKIRKVSYDGIVNTLAGNGTNSYAFVNQNNVPLNGFTITGGPGMFQDKNGVIYFVNAHRIHKLVPEYYQISPTLPSGLTFDPFSGSITGTPTVYSPSTVYTISHTNPCGTISTTINFSTGVCGLSILTQPNSQTECQGNNVTFSVVASGTSLTYQWQKGGINIPGETASTLTINGISMANADNYTCVVSNGICSISSNSAMLTVNPLTTIITQPSHSSSCNTNYNLSVVAVGVGLTYQWQKGGVDLIGEINSSISFSTTTPGNVGIYTCVVTGACGSPVTSTSLYASNPPPATTITVQPITQNNCLGSSFNLSVTATGVGLSYQWKLNGTTISGATASSLSFLNFGSSNFGDYTCVVAGFCGTVTSNVATLGLLSSPNINYIGVSPSYSVGTTISPLLPVNTGDPIALNVVVSTFAGAGVNASQNGTGASAYMNQPWDFTLNNLGDFYLTEWTTNRIKKLSSSAVLTNYAGSGTYGSTNGAALSASFGVPDGITSDGAGNLYIADRGSRKIRKISSTGVVTTIAGSGAIGYADGPGASATFTTPTGIAIDGLGNLYVADQGTHLIRKIDPSGVVSTFAGIPNTVGSNNGPGATATFNGLNHLGIDAAGNLYVPETGNYDIRKITPSGSVSTLAGSGTSGSANGNAMSATFSSPKDVAIDPIGNVYVSDGFKVRKISSSGIVSTIAGSTDGYVDGLGNVAKFHTLGGIEIAPNGNVFVLESNLSHMRKIEINNYAISPNLPAGMAFDITTGVISGTPTVATPSTTYTITTQNSCGYVTTTVTFETCASAPIITTQPVSQSVTQGNSVTFTVDAAGSGASYQWFSFVGIISGATSSSYTIANSDFIDAGDYWCDVSNACGTTSSSQANLTVLSPFTNTGSSFIQTLNTSVGMNKSDSKIQIFPNPTENYVNILFDNIKSRETCQVQVFDQTGREVVWKEFRIENGTNRLQLELGHLITGIYTLRLSSDKETIAISKVKKD